MAPRVFLAICWILLFKRKVHELPIHSLRKKIARIDWRDLPCCWPAILWDKPEVENAPYLKEIAFRKTETIFVGAGTMWFSLIMS